MQFLNSSVQATLPRIFPLLQFTIVSRRGAPSFEGLKNTFKQGKTAFESKMYETRNWFGSESKNVSKDEKIYAKNTKEESTCNPRDIHMSNVPKSINEAFGRREREAEGEPEDFRKRECRAFL